MEANHRTLRSSKAARSVPSKFEIRAVTSAFAVFHEPNANFASRTANECRPDGRDIRRRNNRAGGCDWMVSKSAVGRVGTLELARLWLGLARRTSHAGGFAADAPGSPGSTGTAECCRR